MTRQHDPFAGLLAWYPPSWRRMHGDELIGTLLDDAESRGRRGPTWREHLHLRAMGLGLRLDGVSAVWLAGVAMAIAVAGAATLLISSTVGPLGVAIMQLLQLALGPVVIVSALCALLRHHGLISPIRAVATIVTASGSFAGLFAALQMWGRAFERADAGLRTSPWESAAMAMCALGAWVLGALLITLLLEFLLDAISLPAARWGVAAVGGLVASPVLLLSLMSPTTVVAFALVTLIVAVLKTQPRLSGEQTAPSERHSAEPSVRLRHPTVARHVARGLAWAAATAGAVGLAFALTGSTWPGIPFDSTEAMRAGIMLGHLALALCVIAGAVAVRLRRLSSEPRLVLPTTVLVVSCIVAAAASSPVLGPGSLLGWTGLIAAGVIAGAGIALTVGQMLKGTAGHRWVIGVAVGAAYAVVGFALIPLVALVSSFIALAIGGLLLRPRRSLEPASA